MANINLQNLRTSTFKGFVQFEDPDNTNTYYRMKERQQFSFSFGFNYSSHYADSGTKAFDPTGYDHSFEGTLKVTSDMIDDANPPTDKKAINYWIYKASQQDPIDIVFVAKMIALSGPSGETSETRLWFKFKGRLTSFTSGYSASGGSQDWALRGIITEINTIERSSSDTAPTVTTNWSP